MKPADLDMFLVQTKKKKKGKKLDVTSRNRTGLG